MIGMRWFTVEYSYCGDTLVLIQRKQPSPPFPVLYNSA